MWMRVSGFGCAFVVALCLCGPVVAASSWSAQANKVCVVWQAKAKATFGATPPKTPAQAYSFSVKAAAFEQAELSALEKIPNRTPAGARALSSVKVDIAEINVGIKDWRAGNKTGFVRVFIRWQNDHRPHRAFVAAGANACG
jgi:hypothetical protein